MKGLKFRPIEVAVYGYTGAPDTCLWCGYKLAVPWFAMDRDLSHEQVDVTEKVIAYDKEYPVHPDDGEVGWLDTHSTKRNVSVRVKGKEFHVVTKNIVNRWEVARRVWALKPGAPDRGRGMLIYSDQHDEFSVKGDGLFCRPSCAIAYARTVANMGVRLPALSKKERLSLRSAVQFMRKLLNNICWNG